MKHHAKACVGLAIAASLALVPAVSAQVAGTGTASGTDRLKVKGCGKTKAPAGLSFSIFGDGTWVAVDEEGFVFSGLYTAASAKKLDLSFDFGSQALFVGVLEGIAAQLCGQSVTVTTAERKTFFLKRNKKRTKAKVRVKYALTGTAAGESGKAKYVLKASGTYTEVGGPSS